MNKLNNKDLFKRSGVVKISRDVLMSLNEDVLGALFSNFYPMAIDVGHGFNFYDEVHYIGVSPFFEICEEGWVRPEYNLTVNYTDGKVNYIEFNKK